VNYEVGFKMQSPDGLFYVDLAAFYIDWSNIQLLTEQDGFNFNANGGKAKSEGIEFTGTVNPTTGLSLSVNGALTNARLKEDTIIGGLDGDRLPFTPKFSAAVLADYSFPIGENAEAHVGGSVRHLSSQRGGFVVGGEQRHVSDYQVVDLSAGVDFGKINLDLYVRNLNNSHGRTSTTGTDVFGGFPLYPDGAVGTGVIRPRTFGVTLGVEY
jgi:outer membrane receptor protein involved in Fe transport